ncbi:TPA: hypothetical protein DGT35_02530 [Patescibacteria group bacterium]|nr:hypothetical protein [Patescibacteria group bacterium]
MRNYFYVAVISIAALLLVVGLRTIYAFQGPDQPPPDGNGQLAADGDNIGIGTTSPKASLHVEGGSYFLGGDGEVNGDGHLVAGDLGRIVNWINGTATLTPEEYARADVNGDGSVNTIDGYLLTDVLNQKITIDQANHSVGKQAQDSVFHTTLDGKVGIGVPFGTAPAASLQVNGGSYFLGGNGDVNDDGSITSVDTNLIAGWLNGRGLYGDSNENDDGWIEGDDGLLTPEQYARADVNGDGSVSSIDFYLIMEMIEKDITLDQAHHVAGKRVRDNGIHINLDGDVGIGSLSFPSSKLEVGDKDTVVKMVFKRIDSNIGNGKALGRIIFTGTAGGTVNTPRTGSYIQATAQGDWGSSQSPGDLSFYTTPTGSTASGKRMKIHDDGLVEIIGQLKMRGGSPVKGKFLKAETNSGKAEWDYWPGDHLWGQGRPGVVVKNTSGECTVGDLKISRSIPSVRWEGAAASCPKGWWVCTAAERGTATCGTDTYTVKGCYSNYTNYGGSISAPTVYFYKAGAAHLSELSAGTLWTFGYQTDFRNGVWSQGGVINAWVADAYDYPSTGVSGKSVSINGVISEGSVCEKYPVWCCANK